MADNNTNDDLLAELRAKTAKLASQVQGREDPVKKVLRLDPDDNNDTVTDLKEGKPDHSQQKNSEKTGANPAVELVRNKLASLYKKEPDAAEEAIESYEAGPKRSVHQQFMYDLTTSGKSLADIQTEWHNYYLSLDDANKHQIWKEFYETQNQTPSLGKAQTVASPSIHKSKITHPQTIIPDTSQDPRNVRDIKKQLFNKINAGGKLTAVHHIKSLLFGISMAALVGLILTFTFFNEAFIAPFISPSRNVSATPIIGNMAGDVGPEPKIIIPKINLEVPVVFDMSTVDEHDVQKALEQGVVHYASTPNPGETGNAVVVGHSSNNILNSGKYKFAFVLLKRLEAEDTFFVQKDGIRYTYKVYKKEIVGPDDTSVLETQEKTNTITLITCDPPGTSINRLIIVAEQISPDPAGNKPSTATQLDTSQIKELPSNAPSLWSRIWPF